MGVNYQIRAIVFVLGHTSLYCLLPSHAREMLETFWISEVHDAAHIAQSLCYDSIAVCFCTDPFAHKSDESAVYMYAWIIYIYSS